MNLRARCQQFGWLSAFLLLILAIRQSVSTETRVVCYYTNWSVYRPGTAKFSPQNINPYLCTHLIYAFGGFTKENSLKPFDKYQDIEKGGYAKFTGLKTYNKNLKTMLAIGGWNEGSSRFSPMVASPDRRKELVKNTVKFLRQNHFDGLDLDWEYPSFRDGGKARDRENYAQMVQELREEFDRESEKTGRPRLLLTMAVPAGIEYINKGYDVPKLTKYLDWMNILSYDYHSAFEPAVNHHSPLYPLEEENEYNFDADLNIDHTIKHYLKMGADPNKLVLGIPTYGRSYTLFNPDANEIGAPADGPGDMGDATRENGYLAFYEICENLKENDWKIVQPNPAAMGPYAYKGNQWVSYDDELIVRKKSEYVVENNLGGIMFWSIDNDDFRGHCYNKPYPLIEAAKEALIAAATGKTETNAVSTSSKSRKPIIPRSRTRLTSTTQTKKEETATNTRVQNSGGRQGGNEISNSSGSRKRIRTGSRNKDREEEPIVEKEVKPQRRIKPRGSGRRRKTTTTAAPTTTTTTASSILTQTTPSWKTPEPPTTPDPGGDFKCEEDGFFPHPRDCKKYFWCLSGPADLGIVAHQFTCPAGLYFNKAADSCDYTQNVLCKKNIKTTTTTAAPTTSSTTTTTQAPSTTTRRAPARITAATSRTTFLYSSTTTTTPEPEYYDDEYEYEDDEIDTPRRGEPDSEEDPQVIKELIDLIKKVGGVEELEKYLNLQEDGTMAVTSAGSTTPATISRSLYERVLSRTNKGKTGSSGTTATTTQTRNSLTYSAINRNSRPGPQNAGIEKKEKEEDDSSSKRGRPKYTTITRQRASTEEPEEQDEDEAIEENEEEVKTTRGRQFATSKKSNQPEYVTIRRSRPTAASEIEEETPTRSSLRGRQRGVPGEEDEEDNSTGTQSPEYVTIRRTRPTTEETTTSKYTTIQRRRPATESPEDTESTIDSDISKRRSTTTTSEDTTTIESEPSTFLSNQEKLEEISGTINTIIDDEKEIVSTSTIITEGTAEPTSTSQSISDATTTTTTQNTKTNQVDDKTTATTQESSSEKTSPQLFRPRPFAQRTRGTTTSKPTTAEVTESIIKVSEQSSAPSRNFGGLNRKFQPLGNRFTARGQNKIVASNSDSNSNSDQSSQNNSNNVKVQSVTEEIEETETEEQRKEREEEYRQRIRNRGRSKFTLPTSTASTASRRRRPNYETVTQEYEYDYEELHRTYRPPFLADLSSLTSADIAFQRGNNRKHRRRPVTSESSTTTTTTTEGPTEPSLKTGPRTLPLARKLISESQFGKNTRRIIPASLSTTTTTTESSKETIQITRNPLLLKPRPSYASLVRTTTTTTETTKTTTEESDNELNETTTPLSETEKTLVTKETDSTESQSVNEYKTAEPEESNDQDNNLLVTERKIESETNTETETETESEITTTTETNKTTVKPANPNRKLVRIPIVKKQGETPINRTRKVVIANRRFRPTTTVTPLDENSSSTATAQEATLTRQRSTFLTRNNQRPTITRLRPVKSQDDETETNVTSESNRGFVKRIRPINLGDKNEDEEKIKLSETNISESIGTVRNLPEDDISANRKRKIIRRIRPSKDTIFSELKNDDEIQGIKRIRLSGKNLKNDNLNGDETTDDIEDSQIKRIRPFLTKSESTDIIRSENENDDVETERNDETTTNNIRQGKTLNIEEGITDETEKETETINETTTIIENENKTEEVKPTISTLYKPILNTRKVKFLDTVTTSELPSTVRNRNVIRKFRPGLTTETPKNVVLERNGNRTRKIIRRLRPLSTTSTTTTTTTTTTTESNEVSSTTTESLPLINTEDNIDVTTIIPEIETDSEDITTIETITTVLAENTDEPEESTTTTTTTTLRPSTRSSLIGRSRPAYRPRARPTVEIRSTTPAGAISPIPFRRRTNKITSPKPESEEETEDGVIDDKLKKLYNKKLKYTPIVRSTTERLKALEEEEREKLEQEEEKISSTTEEQKTEVDVEVTTLNEQIKEQEIEITTMENIVDTTITDDITTVMTENIKQVETTSEATTTTTTTTTSTSTPTTETEIKSTNSEPSTTESITENIPETVTENEIITTEMIGNTETEIPTTELYTEANIQEITSENISSSSESITEENISAGTTIASVSLETTSPASTTTTENNKNQESDKAYKPIRYKPSDRPKLRIKLNRTDASEAENEREANDQRNGKFTPSRTLAQRNRSRLAYRKETSTEKSDDKNETRGFIPTGRKLERPKFGGNQIKIETSSEPPVEIKSERSHYPTLKPVISFNREINEEDDIIEDDDPVEEIDEEFDEVNEEPEEEPKQIENPVIKYLQTIRNNQEIIRVNNAEIPEDTEPEIEEDIPEENDEFIDNDDNTENEQNEDEPKFNTPIINRPAPGIRPIQNQPNVPNVPARVPNRPQYTPKRPAINRPQPGPISNKPIVNEPSRPSNIPVAGNVPVAPRPIPTATSSNRNYPRRFNKPVNPTISTTTPESLAGINIEAVNQRNKNLFTKNRKANIPHPGPAVTSSTTPANELEYTPTEVQVTTEVQQDISQVTEETILPEPTTEQLSTLHHVFAEPDIPETTPLYSEVTSSSIETTRKYNFTAAQIEAARSLERLIEVNRIVEVSFKEDKVKNNSGVVETRVKLQKEPTLTRIGAINRVTVIKVVDGNNETNTTSFPSNHALTLNEIITGKHLDIPNTDMYTELHAPDINLTKLNILNNTLEIIKHEKSSTEATTTEIYQETTVPVKIPDGDVQIVNGPKLDPTIATTTPREEKKFEIISKSNVVDYSHRDLDPIQLIAQARPDPDAVKQARKLAIESVSNVANNNRPVFNDPTTLPLEALFQTDSPDFNQLKYEGTTTDIPVTTTLKDNYNDVNDDQDLLESRHHNGRVRIRILGEDTNTNNFETLEKENNPKFAPIRILNGDDLTQHEIATLKADVVEIKPKPNTDTIRIAPIEVSLSNDNIKYRVESSSSLKTNTETQNSVPLKRELSSGYFNPTIIFGETANTRK